VTDLKPAKKYLWLIYTALALAGIILIGDALGVDFLTKLTARIGIALVFSSLALVVAKDRSPGIIAVAVIWIAVIITFFN